MKDSRPGARKTDGCSRFPTLPEGCWKVKESRTAAKEVLGDVSQSMGGSISFAGSAGQQVAMDLTRGALQGGTRFISQRVKAVKVKLKAGYRVLLVTKKQ